MTQLQLIFDPIKLDLYDRSVRVYGHKAVKYTWTPPFPKLDEEEVDDLLLLAESALRYATTFERGILNLDEKAAGAGSTGIVGTGKWMLRGAKGAELHDYEWHRGEDGYREIGKLVREVRVSWPQMLALLRERAEVQPNVKAARDLAEAVHLLDTYQHIYLNEKGQIRRGYGRDDWTPDPLLDGFRKTIRELGAEVPKDLLVRSNGFEPFVEYRYVPPDPQLSIDDQRREKAKDESRRNRRKAA